MIKYFNIRKRVTMVLFAGIIAIFCADYLGLFESIDRHIYDSSFRLKGIRETSDNIVIAAIDEKTLTNLERWPLKRIYYAVLLEKLEKAKIVGIDIIMSESTDEDTIFGEAVKKHGSVVLPTYIINGPGEMFQSEKFFPYRLGHIHIEQDIDNVVRNIFHTLYYNGKQLPSFVSMLYESMTDTSLHRQTVRSDIDRILPPSISQRDSMTINYYGYPGTFKHMSFVDIINGIYPLEFFSNKTVLVGATAAGLADSFLTPFSQRRDRMAGVEVLANALNNLLDNSYITTLSDRLRWPLLIIASVLLWLLLCRLNEKRSVLTWLFSLAVISVTVFFLFSIHNLWIKPTLIYFALSFVYAMTYISKLNEAAHDLDTEYLSVLSLLSYKENNNPSKPEGSGLVSFLSTESMHSKIQRLIMVEQRYDQKLEHDIQQTTRDLKDALSMISSMSNEMIIRLTAAADSKDQYTGDHLSRFGLYASSISAELGLSDEFTETLSFASLMHDIGKIGIPDKVLLKPERLTEDEIKIIETHTTIGAKILSNSSFPKIQMAATIALYHHERWNGTGYPKGLRGEDIPIEARIATICDHYDALRCKRPYKRALDHQEAFEIITKGDKRTIPDHFDPDILNTFIKVAPAFDEIYVSYHN